MNEEVSGHVYTKVISQHFPLSQLLIIITIIAKRFNKMETSSGVSPDHDEAAIASIECGICITVDPKSDHFNDQIVKNI